MKPEELIDGGIYVVDVVNHSEWKSVFRSNGGKKNKERLYLNKPNYNISRDGTWAIEDYSMSFRLATPQEKEHLNQCIKAGKFVEYQPSKALSLNYLIL